MDLASSDIATAGLGSRCRGFVSGPKVCHKSFMRKSKLTTVELVVVRGTRTIRGQCHSARGVRTSTRARRLLAEHSFDPCFVHHYLINLSGHRSATAPT